MGKRSNITICYPRISISSFFGVSLDELSGREELDLQKPQTLAAHLEGELKQEDIDYIMSLVERFKNEDK